MSKRRTSSKKRRKKIEKISDDFEILYETESGFTLEITPFPPYYLDIIEDLYPFLDYPARDIELAAGDVVKQPYTPPEEPPDPDDEDYGLYLRWNEARDENEKVDVKRRKARRDLLLSVCVKILRGPVDIDDEDWVIDLEAPFADTGFKVPEEPGQRKLIFLKYIVIRSVDEAQGVTQATMYKEVSMDGIASAIRGFQSDVGGDSDREDTGGDEGEDSS